MINPPDYPIDVRPMLIEIWEQTRFDSGQCAMLAGVSEQVILAMFRRYPVAREDAERILSALSELLGGNYSL